MARQKAPSPETSAALDHLFHVYERPDIVANINATQYAESFTELSDVSAARRNASSPAKVAYRASCGWSWWPVRQRSSAWLLVGVEDMRSRLTILSGLVIVMSLLLFVVYALNDLFTGGVRADPDALEQMLRQFGSPPATSVSTIQRSAHSTH